MSADLQQMKNTVFGVKELKEPEAFLVHAEIYYNLVNAGVELFNVPKPERFKHGDFIILPLCGDGGRDYAKIQAEVFKPGDRFVLKSLVYIERKKQKQLGYFQTLWCILINRSEWSSLIGATYTKEKTFLNVINILKTQGVELLNYAYFCPAPRIDTSTL